MDEFELLIDLHIGGDRQGPGSDAATQRAIELSGVAGRGPLVIADIGCGTGASTVVLARSLDASVIAVDFLAPFLARLDDTARELDLADRITTVEASMDDLAFDDESLDVIWSEGAVYNIGFEHGVRSWRRFLRPGGVLAVSELTWLTDERPAELDEHWTAAYPEVGTASSKMAILEAAGYSPIGYFVLDRSCWLDEYYRPIQGRIEEFLDRHDRSPAATTLVEAEQHEIELYERHADFVSYGFYVARRCDH